MEVNTVLAMENIIHGLTGSIHTVCAVVALVTGTALLVLTKGTSVHRRMGYLYTAAMIVLLITAFSIYVLFGTFGVFHWLGLVSSVTLAGGMIPLWLRRPRGKYLIYHFSFMYWSVIGLYFALLGEIAAHLPGVLALTGQQATAVLVTVGTVALLFGIAIQLVWNRKKREWSRRYSAGFTQ